MQLSPNSSLCIRLNIVKRINTHEFSQGLLKVCLFLYHIFKFGDLFLLGLPWSIVFQIWLLIPITWGDFKMHRYPHISIFLQHTRWFKWTAMEGSHCLKSTETIDSLSGRFIYNWWCLQTQARKLFVQMVSIYELRYKFLPERKIKITIYKRKGFRKAPLKMPGVCFLLQNKVYFFFSFSFFNQGYSL